RSLCRSNLLPYTTLFRSERQISKSAWIGAFWGIGHTLTILVVGASIIVFDLVIPPRVGLSMELAVGLMLVILGVMNVRSFFRSRSEEHTSELQSLRHLVC